MTTAKEGYHRLERSYGSFVRCFSLPETVDAEKVGAAYKNGVLTISMPKKEVAKPRSIKVKVAELILRSATWGGRGHILLAEWRPPLRGCTGTLSRSVA